MDTHRLVKMANEIAAFFAAEPDRAVAIEGIANHLKRFWEPRMRRAIYISIDQNGALDLTPLALETLRTRRALLEPKEK